MVFSKKMLHNIHLRHRVHVKKQPYPHPDKKIEFLDKVVLVVSAIIPLATLPQVFKIWVEQSAQGVSVLTWSLYLLLSIPMLLYGIVHKNKPITIMYILWILIHASILLGVYFYG